MNAESGTARIGRRPAVPIALAALGMLALSGCGAWEQAAATEQSADDSYSGITALDLRTTDGSTTVTGADVEEVRVERTHRYTGDTAPDEKITDSGGTLRVVSGDCGEGWTLVGGGRCTTDYTVTVPFGTTVKLRGDDGAVTVADPRAAVDVEVRDGDAALTGAVGAAKVHTEDGALDLDGVTAESVAATTRDGRIDIAAKGRVGSLSADSEDGAVDITAGGEVGSLKAASRDGDVSVTTKGRVGSLSADSEDGTVDITAGGAFGALTAATRDGDVTVTTPAGGGPYAVATDTRDGAVRVDVPKKRGAESTIDATTADGGITIRER